MGKKGNWLVAVKRVFSPESKEKKGQTKNKSKKRWGFGKCNNFDPDSSEDVTPNNPAPLVPQESIKYSSAENNRSSHAYSVALASAVAAEAAAVAAQAAAEVVRLTKSTKFAGRSKEEMAAIKIQTAFRGYMARRALRALRGLVRLKSLTNSNAVKCQAAATLRCMQTLARVQAQVRSRRIRMSEENQALQRQLQLKHERALEKLRMAEEWNDSFQSKEQIEEHLQHKQEAVIKRERALAYAFSHQWRSSSKSSNPTFMDPHNPQWGWSWLERWMASRPWDQLNINHTTTTKTPRSYTHHRPNRRPSLSTPPYKPSSRKGWAHVEDDSNSSLPSVQSELPPRRHSVAGSSVRDDSESLGSVSSVPSYMGPTESAKAKARYQKSMDPSSSARKRLSFPAMTLPSLSMVRRHSGPPKLDVATLAK